MAYPDRETALATLAWANQRHPDRWVAHSHNVALSAEAIGAAVGLDREKCYVLGLLHDIGRYPGPTYARHLLDGYHFCMERGWTDVARICLTHSFPAPQLDSFIGWHDVSPAEKAFVGEALRGPIDDFDRLIQLCDALATADGFCILEMRWIDVLMRYGWSEHNPEKWRATLAIKRDFDTRAGCNVYALLPGLAENILR